MELNLRAWGWATTAVMRAKRATTENCILNDCVEGMNFCPAKILFKNKLKEERSEMNAVDEETKGKEERQ